MESAVNENKKSKTIIGIQRLVAEPLAILDFDNWILIEVGSFIDVHLTEVCCLTNDPLIEDFVQSSFSENSK